MGRQQTRRRRDEDESACSETNLSSAGTATSQWGALFAGAHSGEAPVPDNRHVTLIGKNYFKGVKTAVKLIFGVAFV